MAYYYLSKKAEKYVLLAPFINGVENLEKLEKKPVFYKSCYSPVVNEIIECPILNDNDRFEECKRVLNKLNPKHKTLIYFPTVTGMYKYINDVVEKELPLETLNSEVNNFINWAKEEIHEDWCLVKALERGYLIHNGQIPIGTRMFQLDFYEQSEIYNKMLCTSTLLEGVNTTAKNIIITRPSRQSNQEGFYFTAFDFYNLVGRTGRLYEHYIGDAYYIKSPNDPDFDKSDAVKNIQFEITDESKDIDIQMGETEKHKDVLKFLSQLNITDEEYDKYIGSKARFDTIMQLYSRYENHKSAVIKQLQTIKENPKTGRYYLINDLYKICESKNNKMEINLITSLLDKRRPTIKKVVDKAKEFFKSIDINYLITVAIKLKMSYIEHSFYNKISIIHFFLIKDGLNQELLNILDDKILKTIEYLYFSNIKHKKMLIDMGIYERDIDKIIKIIGDDFDDAFELKQRLSDKIGKFKDISYLSMYVIKNLLG